MADDFTIAFEKLWVGFRGRWCDSHDLGGALAFSHERLEDPMFHRVVSVNVSKVRMDSLIDRALSFFKERKFECAFTLSPLDRPSDLGDWLEDRGFTFAWKNAAMVCDQPAAPLAPGPARIEEPSASQYDVWADTMCRSLDLPANVGDVGRSVLCIPEVRLYLARIDGEPAGTTLLYSRLGMGYVDLVGTLPRHRRKGVASSLVTRAVADSRALGNRWTALEVVSGSPAERVYERLGFRPAYHRPRYIKRTR